MDIGLSSSRACGLVLVLFLGACDGAPVTPDAGSAPPDAGSPALDASRPDAFVPPDDAGSPDPDAGPPDAGTDGGPPPLPTECTTTIDAASGGSFVELCAVDDRPRHFRIEGLLTPAFHASAQVVLGFEAPPEGPQVELAEDQLRVLLYGGSMPAPPPTAQATFGATTATLGPPATFLHTPSTVCFDVHEGGASGPPAVVLWVDGANGADCSDRTTLTLESAYGMELGFGGTESIVANTRSFFRQSSGLGTSLIVTISRDPALSPDPIRAGISCETAWTGTTEWQPLCTLSGARPRHIRIEDIETSGNSSYFYLVLGEQPDPTGNPAGGPQKLIVTGGRSSTGASWTWFRFNEGTTTQFRYPTPDSPAPLYTSGPTTVCLDLGEHEGSLRLVFWATGANGADCADPSTLTLENALYDSTTDTVSGSIWNAPLSTEGLSFVKTNNATVTLGRVVLLRDPAAL